MPQFFPVLMLYSAMWWVFATRTTFWTSSADSGYRTARISRRAYSPTSIAYASARTSVPCTHRPAPSNAVHSASALSSDVGDGVIPRFLLTRRAPACRLRDRQTARIEVFHHEDAGLLGRAPSALRVRVLG